MPIPASKKKLISEAMTILARINSPAKDAARRRNAKFAGRPKGSKNKPKAAR